MESVVDPTELPLELVELLTLLPVVLPLFERENSMSVTELVHVVEDDD